MPGGLDDRIKQRAYRSDGQRALLYLLVTADKLRQRGEELCEPYGITITQFNVLRILRGAYPEGHSRSEISARMLERAPDVTRLIDRLEKLRLVERVKDSADRRLSLSRITKTGMALLKRIDPVVEAINTKMEGHLGARACRQLADLCERIYLEEDTK